MSSALNIKQETGYLGWELGGHEWHYGVFQ